MLLLVAACGGKEAAPSKPVAVTADAGVVDAAVVFESVTGDGKGGFVVTQVTRQPEDHDKAIVKRVVHTRRSEIMACYMTAHTADPNLEGVVHVAFTIATTGEVVSATATGMTADLDRCIEGEFRQLKFAAQKKGKPTEVRDYPLAFKR